jgi:hypothetical protein
MNSEWDMQMQYTKHFHKQLWSKYQAAFVSFRVKFFFIMANDEEGRSPSNFRLFLKRDGIGLGHEKIIQSQR